MQAKASGENGGTRLTGGCELWFKHSEPKNINGKSSPLTENLGMLKRCNKRRISASGSGKFGKTQKLVHLKLVELTYSS